MRIASVEVVPYALPFREPYVTARGRLERREMALLRLRSAEGLIGLGEAVPLSLRGGAGLAQVVAELTDFGESGALDRRVAAWTADRESDPEGMRIEGDRSLSPPARCALLTALLDLSEREDAIPRGTGRISLSVGRHDPGPIPCNATLVAGEPAAVAEDALRWAADGFTTFKLKLGAGRDAEQVAAVRDALGPEAQIRVDANGAWDVATAKRRLAELEPLDVELAEQPVATLEEAAELTAETSIPIAADESVETCADAERAVAMGACDLAGLKLSKVGGPEPAIEIAEILPCFVSSALDGPVGIAAAAQVAQTLREAAGPADPDLAQGLATQRLFASTIASVECELHDGMLHPPPGPGLGVEIDEAALAAHRI